MEIRSIKDVDEETWREFKALAAKNNLKMSLLLKMMVNKFEEEGKDFWKKILNRKINLSNKEAEEMKNIILESRKERGFRE